MELDAGLYERQTAGIAALIALANDVAAVSRSGELRLPGPIGEPKQGRLKVFWTRLRQDEMTWNSLYLVMTTGLLAGFGFTFWIITAHLFSVSDVGKASALVSATGLIGNFALFGLNTGISKYLPDSRNPDSLISSGIALVAVSGAVGAGIYLLLIPLLAPQLSFVEKSPALAIGFALITAAASVNTLTDSIFVATRNAKYTAFVDGIIGGFGKVTLGVVLAGAGTYGLFVASTSGLVLAAIASVFLVYTVMHSRLDLRRPLETLKPLLRFAGANYVGNVFNMVPGLAVPVILLDRLGAESAAYFFVVFQIVQIIYAAALALEQTFLAEGSRADADMRALRRRSLRMLVMFCVPAAVGVIAVGHWVLLAFGRAYVNNGFATLIILSLAAGPIALNYWYLTVLRLAGKLRAIVAANATYAVGTCIFTWVGAGHGLTGVATGWFLGAFMATCVAAVAAREGNSRHPQPSVEPGTVNGTQAAREGTEEIRPRIQRPVNPFEAGYGRADPRADPRVNGAPANGVNGDGRHRVQRPANPFEPEYGRVDPRPAGRMDPRVNGAHDPRGNRPPAAGVNGDGRHRVQRPANSFESGYRRVDPRPVNGAQATRENGEGPHRMQPSENPIEPDYDDGTLHRKTSLWD